MKNLIVLISVMSIWVFNYSLTPYVKAEGHTEHPVPPNIENPINHPEGKSSKEMINSNAVGKSLATGQSMANDFSDADRARIKKSMGTSQLPSIDAMNPVNINPAGAASTVIK